jgi:hypothetical protein
MSTKYDATTHIVLDAAVAKRRNAFVLAIVDVATENISAVIAAADDDDGAIGE